MSEPFIAEIRMFGGNFAPRGWALCNGQILPIAQNTALFSLLGTTYGGNGQTTFALPDLRSRIPVHAGQGPGLSNYSLGQGGGNESVTLNVNQMPPHNHQAFATAAEEAPSSKPAGKLLSTATQGTIYDPTPDGTALNPNMIGPTGGGQPHDNIQPYLTVNFIIALEGIYPSRN
ncbi:MAG: tail fiber protein [Acidobacteria bacterium]|nr:tail fiber protein [Acidobacteriota bacterium]